MLMAGMSRTRVIMYELLRLLDSSGVCAECGKTLEPMSKQAHMAGGRAFEATFFDLNLAEIEAKLVFRRLPGKTVRLTAAPLSARP